MPDKVNLGRGSLRSIVQLSKNAAKILKKVPAQVQQKAAFWKKIVENQGLRQARQIKGFHDEPLKGLRTRQRSIRLNLQWRAIYETRLSSEGQETIELVDVVEITPHKY